MKRDSLFFRLFRELPRGFFEMIGRPETDETQYELSAVELKDTSVRLDGVFQPLGASSNPAYIWEAQYYASKSVYANLLAKVGRYLEHTNPERDWVAVVIYPTRSLEQKNLQPYRCLLDSDQLIRVYLDELPPAPPDNFEIGVLNLIAAKPEMALERARAMVPRLQASNRSDEFQRRVVEFIQTVILYQIPTLSRKEIETMLQVTDIRETRVYQEALEEGREEGREATALAVARQLLKFGRPIAEIAEATGLTAAKIRTLKPKAKKR